jgi:hypothetical protein
MVDNSRQLTAEKLKDIENQHKGAMSQEVNNFANKRYPPPYNSENNNKLRTKLSALNEQQLKEFLKTYKENADIDELIEQVKRIPPSSPYSSQSSSSSALSSSKSSSESSSSSTGLPSSSSNYVSTADVDALLQPRSPSPSSTALPRPPTQAALQSSSSSSSPSSSSSAAAAALPSEVLLQPQPLKPQTGTSLTIKQASYP